MRKVRSWHEAGLHGDVMLHHDNFSSICALLAPGGTNGQTFSSSSIET
jgi:hypothetical protein